MAIDIAVIGGGFAGLCAAMHSLRLRPGTRVTVIDARPLPGDPDRRGVGESTSELAAWYLSSRLGLRSTLESEQIVKFGLRFWLAEPGGPRAIDDRIEWGPMGWPTGMQRFCELPLEPHAYQLHRGRLEHTLAERIAEAGAELLGEHRVVAVRPVGDTFELEVEGPLGRRCLRTRWVIDASGDGVPSRQLGVTDDHRLDHGLAASWWWVEGRVDPSSWATDPRVGARSTPDLRMRSTHHFIGDGTWAWLIPLVDGSTIYILESAADHKRLGDEDTGPNTGGMGAYTPSENLTEAELEMIERDVFVPVIDAMRRNGITYRGVLYAGLMMTPAMPARTRSESRCLSRSW